VRSTTPLFWNLAVCKSRACTVVNSHPSRFDLGDAIRRVEARRFRDPLLDCSRD
jgi:hypothetical protein